MLFFRCIASKYVITSVDAIYKRNFRFADSYLAIMHAQVKYTIYSPMTFEFETLPDEIILQVCSYLCSSDVLYSFFDLNTRINTTIEGYYRYVNLLGSSYKAFHYVVSYVLPRIGSSVRSFVLNGNWKSVLPETISTILYGTQFVEMVPNLERLILKWFTCEQLSMFLDNLRGLSQLYVIDLVFLKGQSTNDLLAKILRANGDQIKIITFDSDCIYLDVPEKNEFSIYPNIEELIINIYAGLDEILYKFLPMIPNVRVLHINDGPLSIFTNFAETCQNIAPLVHLVDFQLTSAQRFYWTLDKILDILILMPSLKKLAIFVKTTDYRLVKGNSFQASLPSSITELHLSIRYYDHENDNTYFDMDEIMASWVDYYPIICLPYKSNDEVLLFTIPSHVRTLKIPGYLDFTQVNASCSNFQHIEHISIAELPSLAQLYNIIQHFRYLKALVINTSTNPETCIFDSIIYQLRANYFISIF